MANCDGNGDGQWIWQLPWLMVMETAMPDGEGGGNGYRNGWRQRNRDVGGNGWRRPQQQWLAGTVKAIATATATAMATKMATETGTAIIIVTATARPTMTKGWLPLHVPAMCSAVAGATPCLYPHEHKGVCIHQHCIMGVMLQRVFAPFQGGGFLTSHHGLFFLYFTSTVQFTEKPSACPPHYSGAQEPC
jgi:hypothetical protein